MEISNYLYATIWFILVLWWDVWTDYKRWQRKIPINHVDEWVLRIVLLAPTIHLLSLPYDPVWIFLPASLMVGALWWELFDGFYNKIRKFPWRFNGTVDPDDSWLDKILHKLSPLQETILKWGLIVISTTLYILS